MPVGWNCTNSRSWCASERETMRIDVNTCGNARLPRGADRRARPFLHRRRCRCGPKWPRSRRGRSPARASRVSKTRSVQQTMTYARGQDGLVGAEAVDGAILHVLGDNTVALACGGRQLHCGTSGWRKSPLCMMRSRAKYSMKNTVLCLTACRERCTDEIRFDASAGLRQQTCP